VNAPDVKAKALEIGFDLCGIAPAADHPELGFLREWLRRGYGGTMTYLHRSAKKRLDIHTAEPSARTVVVTGTLYNTDRPYSTEIADSSRAMIARYAWGDDYHDVLGARLDVLLAWMRDVSDRPFEALRYVDTGPVQERAYARHAGIGWIGKNSCVISPELGSWLFLGEIVCSLALDADAPSLDQCGTCTLCLEACPTQAIVAPRVLDSTRCISYLTIEQRGPIPDEHRAGVGAHVYGCDVCQDVCPWNAVAPRSDDPAWQPRPAWDRVDLLTLSQRSDEELTAAMRGSAMKRTKVQGLRRNIAVALDNSSRLTAEAAEIAGKSREDSLRAPRALR
jgi:epoxyqueuosine reductase